MQNQRTLELLCGELSFLKIGGYGRQFRHSNWRPTRLFRDSPLCPNFEPDAPRQPCERCPLFQFVPQEKREKSLPCHHIPMNENGDTIASLYRKGDQARMDEAVKRWLEATIEELRAVRPHD